MVLLRTIDLLFELLINTNDLFPVNSLIVRISALYLLIKSNIL